MSPRLTAWLLVAIVLIGAGLRLYRLDEKSLWSDEIATIATANGNSIDPEAWRLRKQEFDPPSPVPAAIYRLKATEPQGHGDWTDTVNVLRANVHPPLFFLLMNAWIDVVGEEPGPLRLPAVLFGIAAIPVLFCVARRLWPENRNVFGLIAAALLAFSGYQVDHAQDARQYTLIILLALLSLWLALKLAPIAENENPRQAPELPVSPLWQWLLLAVVLTAGLYTQYFFVTFVGFIFLWLLWRGRTNRRFQLHVAGCALLVGLLLLPWMSVFQDQMVFLKGAGHYTNGLWNPIQLPERLWRISTEFLMPDNSMGRVLLAVILFIAGLGWLYRILLARRTGEAPPQGTVAWRLILLWLVVIVGGQIVIDLLKDSHTATIRRYLLLASPACYLLLAYALTYLNLPENIALMKQKRRSMPAVLVALTLAMVLFNTASQLISEHHSSDEFRQAAGWIAQRYQPGDVILVNKTGAMAVGMAYYLPPEAVMWGVDAQDAGQLKPDSPLMARLEMLPQSASRFWMVYSHAAPSTRQRLDEWLSGRSFQAEAPQKFPGVQVVLYRKPSS